MGFFDTLVKVVTGKTECKTCGMQYSFGDNGDPNYCSPTCKNHSVSAGKCLYCNANTSGEEKFCSLRCKDGYARSATK